MKNIFFNRKFTLLAILVIFTVTACKKTETVTVTIQQPTARFSVLTADPFSNFQTTGTTTFIDSSFSFRNASDSGAHITYRWDFGDGATSADKNPKHSYQKRGSYAVTLTVSTENKAFDTVRQTVSVILGQQHISGVMDICGDKLKTICSSGHLW